MPQFTNADIENFEHVQPIKIGFPSNSTKSPKRCAIYTTSSSTNLLSALIASKSNVCLDKAQNLFQTTISASFAAYYSYRVQNLRGQVRITIRKLKGILDLTDISRVTKMKKEAPRFTTLSRKIRSV